MLTLRTAEGALVSVDARLAGTHTVGLSHERLTDLDAVGSVSRDGLVLLLLGRFGSHEGVSLIALRRAVTGQPTNHAKGGRR